MGNTIETVQKVLRNSGNIIKTRDDRELILIDKDGKISIVFVYCFISAFYALKGRKVKS